MKEALVTLTINRPSFNKKFDTVSQKMDYIKTSNKKILELHKITYIDFSIKYTILDYTICLNKCIN